MALRQGYPRTAENDAFLMALFDQLEDEKAVLAPTHPAVTDDAAGRAYVLQFASRIFLTADDEDREGRATKKTARLFLVASQFLEVLRVFSVDQSNAAGMEEVEERIKYARWKAMDIVKALNEGRTPHPGKDESVNETAKAVSDDNVNKSVNETAKAASDVPDQQQQQPHSPIMPSLSGSYKEDIPPPQANYPAQSQTIPTPPSQSRMARVADAEKHARYAVSALQFEDFNTAIKELEYTLALVRQLI